MFSLLSAMFVENELSDTVVEFKVTGESSLSTKNVVGAVLLLVLFVWSLLVGSHKLRTQQ